MSVSLLHIKSLKCKSAAQRLLSCMGRFTLSLISLKRHVDQSGRHIAVSAQKQNRREIFPLHVCIRFRTSLSNFR